MVPSLSNSAKCNVLVVEDHADSARALARLLKAMGYTVDVASGLAEARQKTDEDHFDLLISDLTLLDGNGLDLMRHLREQNSSIKAIALSGHNDPSDKENCKDAGFDLHLSKPLDFPLLKQKIEQLTAQ
jgi:CheY-like chemotaxis protein